MNNTKASTVTVSGVCGAVCRRKWRAGAFFLFVMTAVTLVTLLSSRVYNSEGKLFVRVGRENAMLDPTATLGKEPVITIPNSRENDINTVVEALKSRGVIEHVVDLVGAEAILDRQNETTAEQPGPGDTVHQRVDHFRQRAGTLVADLKRRVEAISPNPSEPLGDRDKAIIAVSRKLDVYAIRKSSVINIGYESHSPELSRAIVAGAIEFYLEQHARLNRPEGAHAFFAGQKADRLEELTSRQEQLRDLRNRTGPVSLDGQRKVVVERIAQLEDELFRAERSIAAGKAKMKIIRQKRSDAPEREITAHTSGIGNKGTDDIRALFYALQIQEQEAVAKYKDTHPKMQHIREQIAAAREILKKEDPTRDHVVEAPGKVYQEAQLALLTEEPLLASLEAQIESLRPQLAAARQQWNALNEHDLQLAELQRDVELCEANYRSYAANFEQTRIDQALQEEKISNINVLQEATYNAKPIRPRKLVNLALGLLVGALGGLGLALLADNRDRPFLTREELESDLDLPMLASIPRLSRRQLVLNGRN